MVVLSRGFIQLEFGGKVPGAFVDPGGSFLVGSVRERREEGVERTFFFFSERSGGKNVCALRCGEKRIEAAVKVHLPLNSVRKDAVEL